MVLFFNHLTYYSAYELYDSVNNYVLLIDEFSRVITPLLAVFELVLFMIVPRDLPVHYYALHAVHKVHFIITLSSLGPRMSVITRLRCISVGAFDTYVAG